MTSLVESTGTPAHDSARHAHVWQLRSVDYDDGVVSNRYECEACDAVWFT